MNDIMDMKISGSSAMPGGEYRTVSISGSGKVQGSLRCESLRRPPQTELEALLQQRFTAMLARRTLQMNDRIQILSRAGIREKLMAFFTECARDAGSSAFDIPFDRAGMAAYLGVDRSALSRMLSQLQAQGVLRYRKNHFELLGGG